MPFSPLSEKVLLLKKVVYSSFSPISEHILRKKVILIAFLEEYASDFSPDFGVIPIVIHFPPLM